MQCRKKQNFRKPMANEWKPSLQDAISQLDEKFLSKFPRVTSDTCVYFSSWRPEVEFLHHGGGQNGARRFEMLQEVLPATG